MTTTWSDKALAYRSSFATLCAGAIPDLLDRVGGQPGTLLLDVGCGDGSLAAEAVRRGMAVTACDPDPGMRALAREATAGEALILDAGLPDLPGIADGAFDVTVANFVVNHIPDPRAGLRGLARAVRPGGLILFTIWTTTPPPHVRAVSEALLEVGAASPAGAGLPAELDFPRTPGGMRAIAEAAGLDVDAAEEIGWTWDIRPEALWLGFNAGIGSTGERFLAQDEATRGRVTGLAAEGLAPRLTDGVYHLPCTAGLCVARRP